MTTTSIFPTAELDTAPEDPAQVRRQAEVQVFDPIGSDLIVDISVKNERVKRELEPLMDRIGVRRPVVVVEQIFRKS